jgi:predicted dehydrogenase
VGKHWVPLSHASAITAVDDAELVAVCDVMEAAAQRTKERFRAQACYSDFREMLRCEQLDAVAIATRTAERKEIIEQCVAHGIRGFFCEKPLCLKLEDADRLTALLRRNSVAFVYGTRRRYMPIFRRVKEALDRGHLGQVHTIVMRFGCIPLLWQHPHTVDVASFFAGDTALEWVQADLALDLSLVAPPIVDADPLVRCATLRFVNGVTAHIVSAGSFDVEIAGTGGMVTVFSDGAAAEWRTPGATSDGSIDPGHLLTRQCEENTDDVSGTIESVRALIAALRGELDRSYDLNLLTRNHEALFGMVYSHLEEGRRIHWPIERRGWEITGRFNNLYP